MIHKILDWMNRENRYICITCRKAFSHQLARDRFFICPCRGYLIHEGHL